MKNIYLIIGASGSGKTTVTELLARDHGLKTVWSYTTRPPRFEGEEGHIFVSDEEFDQLGEMCAYTEYNGYRYGVTSEIIDQSDIYVIDPPGVSYLKQHYKGHKGLVTVFLDISEEIRRKRMEARGDDPEAVERRLEMDRKWFDKSTFDFNLDFMLVETYDPDKARIEPQTPDEVAKNIMDYISLTDLSHEAFEVCGFPKETIENELGHFIVTYSDNIWCYFHDDDFLFLIEKTVNTLGEMIFSVEFI